MGYDRISALPDSLITQILLSLPTRDSVKTSVLSTRWRNLWFDVPGLEILTQHFPSKSEATNKKFIDRFLEFNRQSRLQKFKLVHDSYRFMVRRNILKEWIAKAVDRGIEDLNVKKKIGMYGRIFIPMHIYKSKTLVSLTLAQVWLENPEFVVFLPCLKIMHLEDICNNPDVLLITEKLILGCPVIEDLTFVRDHYNYVETRLLLLRVRSQTLKIFRLTFDWDRANSQFSVEIDAPGLEYLSFRDSQHARIVVKNMNSLSKIDIDSNFNSLLTKRDTNHDFLNGIYSVKDTIISQSTLEVLKRYSTLGQIPKFQNLSHLQAAFSSSMLKVFPIFLESFPNLKNLILDFYVSKKPKKIDLTYVPRCLSSTLTYVEINQLIMWEENGNKLVRYILENSAVLMNLNLSFTSIEALDIYEELLTAVKHSRRCKIDLFY